MHVFYLHLRAFHSGGTRTCAFSTLPCVFSTGAALQLAHFPPRRLQNLRIFHRASGRLRPGCYHDSMTSTTNEATNTPETRSVKVGLNLHSVIRREAEKRNQTIEDFLELAVVSLIDRSANGYLVEGGYLIRELQNLELLAGRLAISNLTIAEALSGLEGAALRVLLRSLTQLPGADQPQNSPTE